MIIQTINIIRKIIICHTGKFEILRTTSSRSGHTWTVQFLKLKRLLCYRRSRTSNPIIKEKLENQIKILLKGKFIFLTVAHEHAIELPVSIQKNLCFEFFIFFKWNVSSGHFIPFVCFRVILMQFFEAKDPWVAKKDL